jgi:DNA-binding MarR family transcriptional regulator
MIVSTTIVDYMKRALQTQPKTRNIGSAEESTFLELLRTCDQLTRELQKVLKEEELSATQYNVLRILRGSPDGLPCGEIGNRMITRDPDITRLLDRLEKRGLITRCRETRDRRMVFAKISASGLDMLERLDEPVQEVHKDQLGQLGRDRMNTLCALLGAVRKREP